MIRSFLALLSIFFCVTPHAIAQHMNAADSPCTQFVATADLVNCLAQAKSSSEATMHSIYERVVGKLTPVEVKDLADTQRLWAEYRDSNCAAERELYGNGTAGPPAYLACMESMTRHRTSELEITYAVRLK